MDNFVNKIKTKDGSEYNIQDQRLSVTPEDAGKMVAVNESGELTLVDVPSGGTKLYKHAISFGNMGFQFSIITTNANAYNSISALPQIEDCISVSPLTIQAIGASLIPYGRYLLGKHFYWVSNTTYLYYRNSDASFSIEDNSIVVTNTETQVDGTENFNDTVTEL